MLLADSRLATTLAGAATGRSAAALHAS